MSIETDIIFDHLGLINIGFASIDHDEFKKAAELIRLTSISNYRNNIYTIGNGASAAIAQHWACDYTKGCKKGGMRPRVISLTFCNAPASDKVIVEFWTTLPVVPSNRVIALSVDDAGPLTSP